MTRAEEVLSQIYEYTPQEMKDKLSQYAHQGIERAAAKRKIANLAGAKAFAKDMMRGGAMDHWAKGTVAGSGAGFVAGRSIGKELHRRDQMKQKGKK